MLGYLTDLYSRFCRIGLVFLIAITIFSAANPAISIAQRFEVLTPRISGKEAKVLGRKVTQALRDQAVFQANEKDIEKFFMQFYFPKMTSTVPADLGNLSKYRANLLKWIRTAQVKSAQTKLTDMAIKAGRGIARGNFHPAVRYNATLLLGALDKEIATASNPPLPLPEGTAALVELLENDTLKIKQKEIKVAASVKAGALYGLERHARFGIAQDYSDRVSKVALAVIANNDPGDEVTREVHHWMQCMAARVLARQFKDGPNQDVQNALNSLLADEKMSFEDRCSVIENFGKMNYESAAIDGNASVIAIAKLTQAMAKTEAEESKEFEDQALEKGPIGKRGNFNKVDLGPEYPRNRLLNRLVCITSGAQSLSKGLQDADKQKIDKLTAELQNVISIVQDKGSIDLDITDSVQQMHRAVDRMVSDWLPSQSAEAEDDEFAG